MCKESDRVSNPVLALSRAEGMVAVPRRSGSAVLDRVGQLLSAVLLCEPGEQVRMVIITDSRPLSSLTVVVFRL